MKQLTKELEEARRQLEQSHREWMAALDAVDDPIFIHDGEFRVLRANRAYQQRAGIPFKQIIGRPYYEIFPITDGPLPGCRRAVEEKRDNEEDEALFDGRVYRSRAYPVYGEQGEFLFSVHSLEDVTERKHMEASLVAVNARLSEAQRLAQLGSWELDLIGNVLTWSDEIYRIFEIDPAQFGASYEAFLDAIHPEDRSFVNKAYTDSVRDRTIYDITHQLLMKDGRVKHVREVCKTFYDEDGKPVRSIGTVQDITERKQHELAVERANRALRTISAGNQTLIHADDETQLLREMCHAALDAGGYRMAWVGYAGDDGDKSIRPMAQAGFDEGYLESARITWADNERGRGPTGTAVRTGRTQVAQNILTDPHMAPWREAARERGYASNIALPLMDGERCFGVLAIYDSEADAFDADEVRLLEEMAGDLAFGILTLRIKAAHQEHEQRLQKNMLQTVEAIAKIVEMRDPYTSGHQARVAHLAREIAFRMGLPEEQAQAIHLAGLVHDLGKIRVPAEILSKPGSLDEIEYSLIKIHPQAGYDILKGVDFSWPIAQMVLQHHERMDGSGYPQGLKGDDILPGARILSVADVVEAMSSHRPYRVGRGIEAALEEIVHGRGTRFDPQAVDACLALFHEQHYSFG
ncbi:MAG: hypothetical protein A2Z95_04990 [Gallionellales bacterium GWA2_60_18]|nr:MAG: hypothetical protein A2Z95_04990 [Gallionellales bacterium GWA2_60_18]